MVIGLDMDEVLVGFLPAFIDFHNNKYCTHHRMSDFSSYDFWKALGVGREEGFKRMDVFFETDYFRNIKPVTGAVAGVDKLSEDGELVVITSRPDWMATETRACLDQYFPEKFAGVYFSNHAAGTWGGNGRKKSDLCRQLGAELLVDDCLGYALDCANEGVKVVLPDYPYNQAKELPEGVIRVDGWDGILREILGSSGSYILD